MALPSVRMEFRIALSNLDRGVSPEVTLVAALHPSETLDHLMLRVLAWCLLWEEGIAFGAGLSTPDAADLWTRDLTGRVVTWVEVGAASAEKVRKVLQQNSGAAVHVVFDEARRREELRAALAGYRRASEIALWTVDAALVAALAAREQRRQRWTVTVVGDHLYVEADGVSADGAVERGTAA